MLLTVRRSITDQEGLGREVAISLGRDPRTCPVSALREWLSQAQITSLGHRSMEVPRRYIRHGTVWTDNAATTLGLSSSFCGRCFRPTRLGEGIEAPAGEVQRG